MSRNHKDAVGGHPNNMIRVGSAGTVVGSPKARKWAKRFTAREARREHKKIVGAALCEHVENALLDFIEDPYPFGYEEFVMLDPYEDELYDDFAMDLMYDTAMLADLDEYDMWEG